MNGFDFGFELGGDGWDFGWGYESGWEFQRGGTSGIFNIPPISISYPVYDWSIIGELPESVVPPELEEWPDWSLEPILETRPGEIPSPYPGSEAAGNVDPSAIIGPYQGADTAEQQEEEPVVAHDWGHLGRQLLEGIGGQVFGNGAPAAFAPGEGFVDTSVWTSPSTAAAPAAAGGACDGMAWSGGTPPKGYKVVNYCGQGVLRKVRRRRRRRLLTASDSRDIATIVGLVGKGQMASALINRR